MTKHRSRRQRKKLHVGEFQEFGFAFKTQLKEGAREELFAALLAYQERERRFGGVTAPEAEPPGNQRETAP